MQALIEEVARDASSEDDLDIDFDEARSVIDMEEVETRRALTHTVSMFTPAMQKALRDLKSADDSSDSWDLDTEEETKKSRASRSRRHRAKSSIMMTSSTQPIILTQELCSLQ